ncbi:MAG: DegV family EDD domain-containing protein, partial [Clostridia bacterium]|nr:DegV family EDD domain-containing protein [Clostridia bacterium]
MYVIFTDTDTDITPEIAKEYGYHLISMPYTVDDKEIYPYVDFDKFDYHEFYQSLRDGLMPKTSGLSPETYRNYFEPFFKEGKDILYVHFSAAMSGTFSAMNLALDELKKEYPERKFYTVDTKGITIESYNIVREVGDLYLAGKTAEEIVEWAKTEVDKFAIYFFAEDLNFFRRSGRVSNFKAFMGNILKVHPIIYMGSDGMMTSVDKA